MTYLERLKARGEQGELAEVAAKMAEALAYYRGVNAVLKRHFAPPLSNELKVETFYRPIADDALAAFEAYLDWEGE